MEVVALGVGDAEPFGEQGADRGLAGSCDAHDHDDVGVFIAASLAVFFDIVRLSGPGGSRH
ncbi:hypothetical protein OIM90_26725 [Streptomyces sp. AD16]|nr:hypothetical protein NQP46_05595 [Streptomyces albus]WDV34643.1 hypothetical protein OIM90_26725 [Streptomyces sp. AD16]